MSPSFGDFENLVAKVEPHSRLVRVWELKGGVSAEMTALEIDPPNGEMKRMIVRHPSDAHLARNPACAIDEFRILELTRTLGLPSPTPYHLEPPGDIYCGPCLVIEYIDGETDFAPLDLSDYICQISEQLAKIHRADCSDLDSSFLPKQNDTYAKRIANRPATLDESIGEGRIRDALESAWPWGQRNESTLLHGDFWPGNILWKDGRIAGVIDWEHARIGDPIADLANGRLELLWAFGIDAMNEFTQRYHSITGLDLANLPYWDLCSALVTANHIDAWAEDAATANKWRERLTWFASEALERI